MKPRNATGALGAIAVALAAVLAVILIQRPPAGPDTMTSPISTVPTAPAPPALDTPTPVAQETDPATEGEASPLPNSEVDAHDASPGTTPYSQTDEARDAWQPIAIGFGKSFTATKGKNATQWRNSLAPYVTETVRDELATVDLRNVPAGDFNNIEAAEYGDDKVAVFVHYNTGLTLVTYLILDGTSWRIYAYDRWEE